MPPGVVSSSPLTNPKIAVWIVDGVGRIYVAQARPIRLPGMREVPIMENATGGENIAAVVSYNRIGTPQALEAGTELQDANGVSIMELPFRQVRQMEGDVNQQFS